MVEFKKELEQLINKHSIENRCDIPDYLLAELICNFINVLGHTTKQVLDWHGCDSTVHPSPKNLDSMDSLARTVTLVQGIAGQTGPVDPSCQGPITDPETVKAIAAYGYEHHDWRSCGWPLVMILKDEHDNCTKWIVDVNSDKTGTRFYAVLQEEKL